MGQMCLVFVLNQILLDISDLGHLLSHRQIQWYFSKSGHKTKNYLISSFHLWIILGGTTYQTGLAIYSQTDDEYVSLTNEKMAQLRSLYCDLQVMILDEMSMLGAGRLYDIHHRWQDIKVSRDIMGGIASLLGNWQSIQFVNFTKKCNSILVNRKIAYLKSPLMNLC